VLKRKEKTSKQDWRCRDAPSTRARCVVIIVVIVIVIVIVVVVVIVAVVVVVVGFQVHDARGCRHNHSRLACCWLVRDCFAALRLWPREATDGDGSSRCGASSWWLVVLIITSDRRHVAVVVV